LSKYGKYAKSEVQEARFMEALITYIRFEGNAPITLLATKA
jgi:hypothetical protein